MTLGVYSIGMIQSLIIISFIFCFGIVGFDLADAVVELMEVVIDAEVGDG